MEKNKILVIEDNLVFARILCNWLRAHGFAVESVTGASAARKALGQEHDYGCVLADVRLPDGDGMDILEWLVKKSILVPYIVMTQNEDVLSAVRAMKLGAKDYLPKKLIDEKSLLRTVKDAMADRNMTAAPIFKRTSHAYTSAVKKAKMVATVQMTVLITGENGSGKEHVAQMIHEHSKRTSKPFVAVDCGTLSQELALSELFGHKKGAFTGSTDDKKGLFAQADGGTLFLDEIGNLSYEVQVKLLRAMQERTYRPVGGTCDLPFDIRFIAATNEDLPKAIDEGRFRKDLYFRLNEFEIGMPSLRDCREDILPLAEFFKETFCKETDCTTCDFTEEAKLQLLSYTWPGNVRELRNCIRKAVLLSGGGDITEESLELPVVASADMDSLSLHNEQEERKKIADVLRRTNWNKSRAAELLGISRPTLYKKMDKYDLRKT